MLKRLVVVPVAFASCALVIGCEAGPKNDGERPGVITPAPGKGSGTTGADTTAKSSDRVLAEVNGVKVTESQVAPVLMEAYGLDVMLKVMQLNMARAAAAQQGITVSPEDVRNELKISMALAFPDQKPEDYDELLAQFLSNQRVSMAEFNVVMETNAYLRALVSKTSVTDITEEAVRAEFNSIYGERVRVRHIALSNLQEVAEVQRRLNGVPATATTPALPPQSFEQLARQFSKNAVTGRDGGAMPEFARTTGGIDPVFAQAAFALQPGEVSKDAVLVENFYHLIKLEARIPPKGQQFEQVRDSVREELVKRRQSELMASTRRQFASLALAQLQINEPTLKKQFDERVAASRPRPAEREEIRRSLGDSLNRATTRPATPTTTPIVTRPASQPTTTTRPSLQTP